MAIKKFREKNVSIKRDKLNRNHREMNEIISFGCDHSIKVLICTVKAIKSSLNLRIPSSESDENFWKSINFIFNSNTIKFIMMEIILKYQNKMIFY